MNRRDEFYKSFCYMSSQYDKVIDWIKANNPYCAKFETDEQREDFACGCVNDCIRTVIFGDVGYYSSTGMALAVRVSGDPKQPGYKQVRLLVDI